MRLKRFMLVWAGRSEGYLRMLAQNDKVGFNGLEVLKKVLHFQRNPFFGHRLNKFKL